MTDLALTATGDLVPNFQGGFTLCTGLALDIQDINYRCNTNNPDQILWNLGANLEDLIGLPNTQATGNLGVSNVKSALTFDKRFGTSGITVDAVPLSLNQIMITIAFSSGQIFTTSPLYSVYVDLTGTGPINLGASTNYTIYNNAVYVVDEYGELILD